MSLRVALIHNAVFPVQRYGGTERVVWWLAKGLAETGHKVQLVCDPRSNSPFGQIFPIQKFNSNPQSLEADVLHFFNTPPQEPEKPYLVTIGGNGRAGERFLSNTVFVSQNHAQRHGGTEFVYNGLDPEEYVFNPGKRDGLLFLAKASWSVKNVKGAIRIARSSRKKLNILGGSRWWLPHWQEIHWRGMLGGPEKADWIARSEALLFPVLWHEPFGIAVAEALVSGTPVLATPFGSLKELVPPQVGSLCTSYQEFTDSIRSLNQVEPTECRDWALSQFHYRDMTRKYLRLYEKVSAGAKLHAGFLTPQLPITKVPFDFY